MKRIASWVLCLAVVIGLATSPALADDTWLPSYNSSQTVFVAPSLSPELPADFESQIKSRAGKHGLDVRVIITKPGSDLSGERKSWAPQLLRTTLWDRWSTSPGFAEQNMLVILLVYANGEEKTSFAARAGSKLHGWGVNRNRFNDPNGPVITAAKRYLPTEPGQAVLALIDNVNADIDRHLAGQQQSSSGSTKSGGSNANIGILILVAVVALLGVAGTFFWFMNRSSHSSSSQRPSSRSSSTNYWHPPGPSSNPTSGGNSGGNAGSPGHSTATVAGAAILGGAAGLAAGSALDKRNDQRKDNGSGGSTGSDGGGGCSSPAAPSGGGDSGGGGSSCGGGGGGCGGGGCGGGGCGG